MTRLVAVVAGVAVIAAAVVLSGVISVKASSGHAPPTAWVLDLVKRRSVAMRARGIEAPEAFDDSMVRVGAAHFDLGCRPCHGAPAGPTPVIPSRMTPNPPDLAALVGRWRRRELFYLVGHGVKFTGMPAWPSPPRGDEVWSVVAFLERLPALDADAYRRLVGRADASPSADAPDSMATRCRTCHRPAADPRHARLVPRLEGQSVEYLIGALEAYADGTRHSGFMRPIAATLDPTMRRALATGLSGPTPDPIGSPWLSPQSLIVAGDPARDVPACASCHGPSAEPRDPRYPALAGQPRDYLRLQLQLFAEDRRGGSSHAAIMQPIARRLTASQRDAVAADYEALTSAESVR